MSKAARLGMKKTGGRKRGVPNRKTQALIDRARELGCDPFDVLCHFANGNWKALGYEASTRREVARYGDDVEVDTISAEMRLSAAKDLCQYLYPRRKAIEIDNPVDVNVTVAKVYETEWGATHESPDETPAADT